MCTLAARDGHLSTRLSVAFSGGIKYDPCVFVAMTIGCSCVGEQRESGDYKKSLLKHRVAKIM